MLADRTSSFENYLRERKAMMDRARLSTAAEPQNQGAPMEKLGTGPSKTAKASAPCIELLEVISYDEKATAATQPLTPMESHSWSVSSNSIIMNTYPGDLDDHQQDECDQQQQEQGEDQPVDTEARQRDCGATRTSRHFAYGSPAKKSILSYSSDASGLFSPLYEVTSAHVNVFKSTRKPLPKAGKTPRFGNLSYKKVSIKGGCDSLKTERTSNASQPFAKTPPDTVLSFDFSMERSCTPTNQSATRCTTTCSDVTRRDTAVTSIRPARTFEAFMRGEWQLDRVSLHSESSSTEALCGQQFLGLSVDTNDENRIEGPVDSPPSTCIERRQYNDDPELLDAIIEVQDAVDRNGNAIIVLREICPKTLKDDTDADAQSETLRGDFGIDVRGLRRRNSPLIDLTCCTDRVPPRSRNSPLIDLTCCTDRAPPTHKESVDTQPESYEGFCGIDVMEFKRRNKQVIDLTCCTDSEVLSFKMPHQAKFNQILSVQRQLSSTETQLSCAETPLSYVYSLLSDTSQYLKWDRVLPFQGMMGSTKHPLLVLSEHFRDMRDMTELQLAKARLTPNQHEEVLSPNDIMQHFNDRFKGWSIQRTRNGMILVYQGDDYLSGSDSTESAGMRSIECSSESSDVDESIDKEKIGEFDSEVIADTDLRAVMKITNNGEDVSIIFPAMSFDTIDEEESDDGLGSEMEALLGLQTQLESAMHVATTLTPRRFPLELTSPFAEHLYSKDSSMASFGEVAENTENSSNGGDKCKRRKRRSPRRLKVEFDDDIQEYLYMNDISNGTEETPRKRKASSPRKRTFLGDFLGVCQDVAEELSFSCVAMSGICSRSARAKSSKRPSKKKNSKSHISP
jgi:hypothetical protein